MKMMTGQMCPTNFSSCAKGLLPTYITLTLSTIQWHSMFFVMRLFRNLDNGRLSLKLGFFVKSLQLTRKGKSFHLAVDVE